MKKLFPLIIAAAAVFLGVLYVKNQGGSVDPGSRPNVNVNVPDELKDPGAAADAGYRAWDSFMGIPHASYIVGSLVLGIAAWWMWSKMPGPLRWCVGLVLGGLFVFAFIK